MLSDNVAHRLNIPLQHHDLLDPRILTERHERLKGWCEGVVAAGEAERALRHLTGMMRYYDPEVCAMAALAYGLTGEREKGVICRFMSGTWGESDEGEIVEWIRRNRSGGGNPQLLSRLPRPFRMRRSRLLYPSTLVDFMKRMEFPDYLVRGLPGA